MQTVNSYYQPSGKLPLTGLLWMAVFGLLAALFLGFIYAYVIHYILFIPLIRWLGFIMPLIFGLIVGALVGQGGKVGKVRNMPAAYFAGMLAGLLAVYSGWSFWIFSLTTPHTLPLTPLELLGGLLAVAQKGTWGYHGLVPTGMVLGILWLLEALQFAIGSAFMARLLLRGEPFCESCNRWVALELTLPPLAPLTDPAAVKAEIEGGRFTLLTALQKAEAGSAEYTIVKLRQCEGCHQFNLLSVDKGGTMIEKDGKRTKTASTLLESFIIDGGVYFNLSQKI